MSAADETVQWLFEHADRTGATFAAAQGRIKLTSPTGTAVTLMLAGPDAQPLDAVEVAAAIGLAIGTQLVAVRAVNDGWALVTDDATGLPTHVQVGAQTWSIEDAAVLAGRIGTALMQARVTTRLQQKAAVEELAATIAGRPLSSLSSAERAHYEAAARRVLAKGAP